MLTLILETCTERGMAALADADQLIEKIDIPFGFNNSKMIMPAVDKLLGDSKVGRIVLGVGPGSYTGIRIGATIAKTLSFIWNVPICPVSTLSAFMEEDKPAIIDAKISGVYLQLPRGEAKVCALEDLSEALGGYTTLITPNAARLKEKIPGFTFEEKTPDPVRMLQAVQKSCTHDELELLYLRKTQAELELSGI